MLNFFLTRLVRAFITITLVVTACFFVLRLSGDPAYMILGMDAPPEALDAFRRSWGLDQPLWIQYIEYFKAVFRGDLGQSMRSSQDAMVVVLERVPMTLALTLPAFALKLILGLPAGMFRSPVATNSEGVT